MATGDLHELGTLYTANTKRLLPTNPWRSGTTPGSGNVTVFSAGQTIEIRDTDADDAYKIRWREVNIGDKKLLISDRNLLEQVSWDDLNAQELIFGKTVTIDGQEYKLRVLTGGEEKREGGTGSSYEGGKLPNEWDDIIVNEGSYSGLPTPNANDLAQGPNNTQRDGAHNQFWHWYYIYSWCQETYLHNGSGRAIRGYNSARGWNNYASSSRTTYGGWRPVLEVLNSAPVISGEDENLGSQATPLEKVYSVTDPEGDPFSIVERVGDYVIRTIDPAEVGANYIFDTTDIWGDLELGNHMANIIATDDKGAASTRVWLFSKTNQAPAAPLVNFPLSGMRTKEEFYVTFRTNEDPEDDPQFISVDIADDDQFTANKITIDSGFEINRNGIWEPFEFLHNEDAGKLCRVKVEDMPLNKQKYLRVGALDGGSSGSQVISYSDAQLFSVGDTLEVLSEKFELDYRPNRLNIVDQVNYHHSIESFKVCVTNNANDNDPIWEDATERYLQGKEHNFTNYQKSTDKWAVQVKYVIVAGLSTLEISISAHGGGIS